MFDAVLSFFEWLKVIDAEGDQSNASEGQNNRR